MINKKQYFGIFPLLFLLVFLFTGCKQTSEKEASEKELQTKKTSIFCDHENPNMFCTPEKQKSNYFLFSKDSDLRIVYKSLYYHYHMNDVDIKTFEPINALLARDKNGEYFEGKKLNRFLPKNITMLGERSYYGKDTKNFYAFSCGDFSSEKIKEPFLEASRIIVQNGDNLYCFGKMQEGIHPSFRLLNENYAIDQEGAYFIDIKSGDTQSCSKFRCTIDKLSDANPKHFVPLSGRCAKDNNVVYCNGQKIWGADANSFKRINNKYSRDKNFVYFYGERILGVKYPEDFEDRGQYATDGESVFVGGSKRPVNLDTFYFKKNGDVTNGNWILRDFAPQERNGTPLVENTNTSGYKKKGDSIFYEFFRIDGADADTFAFLGMKYAKDKNTVYYAGEAIEGSDPDTFLIIEKDKRPSWKNFVAKDKNALYYGRKKIPIRDTETFKMQDKHYATDRFSVYWNLEEIEGSDPSTFSALNNYFQKDSNYVYFQGKILKEADPKTFLVVNDFYQKDKNTVYYNGVPIVDSDPDTFVTKKYLNAEDANAIYTSGLRVPKQKRSLSVEWLSEPQEFTSDDKPFSFFIPETFPPQEEQHHDCRKVGVISEDDPEYAHWNLVLCTVRENFYGSVEESVPFRIITNGKEHKIIFEGDEQFHKNEVTFSPLFSKKGMEDLKKYMVTNLQIPEIIFPKEIILPTEKGNIVLKSWGLCIPSGGASNYEIEPSKGIYLHPQLGEIFRGTGAHAPGAFFFRTPDGFPVFYGVDYSDILLTKTKGIRGSTDIFESETIDASQYTFGHTFHCEAGSSMVFVPDEVVEKLSLQEYAKTRRGDPLFGFQIPKKEYHFRDFEKKIRTFIIFDYDSFFEKEKNEEQFFPEVPGVLLWKDPLGNWVRLVQNSYRGC